MQTQVTINKPNQKDYLKIEELKPGSWYVIKDYRHNQGLVGKIGICASVRNQETFDCRNAFIDTNGDDLDHHDLRFEMLEKISITVE